MNTDSCDMIKQPNDDATLEGPPGSFCIEVLQSGQRVMWHVLPDGSAGMLRLRPLVNPEDTHRSSWHWDGNVDKPTLMPSVHLRGRWHGWIRNGRMESC